MSGLTFPLFSLIFGDMFNVFFDESIDRMSEIVKYGKFAIFLLKPSDSNVLAIYFLVIGVASLTCEYIMLACWGIVGERIAKKLRTKFFSALLRQEPEYFDVNQSGVLVSQLSADISLVKGGVSEKIGTGLSIFSQIIAGIVIAFVKGWKMTLVMVAASPVLIGVGALQSVLMSSNTATGQKREAQNNNLAQETISGIKTVYSFNAQQSLSDKYLETLKIAHKSSVKRVHMMAAGSGFSMFFIFAVYALGFWYGGKLVVEGEMKAGDVLAVFFAVLVASMGTGQGSKISPDMAKAKGAAAGIFEVIGRVPSIDTNEGVGTTIEDFKGRISFKKVSFAYPSRVNQKILDNFSMKVKAGQTIAIVGPSGSGKSTIIQLIERFYKPSEGKITFDGVNIEEIDLNWLRDHMALVSQEPILFSGTIKENILWGKPDASFKEVKRAAKKANAYNFITELTNGFDTQVGEKGTKLSGGQKQRIAIARAVLRDPKILLLDEATSALDAESEHLVQEALDKLMKGRTTIIVAHRLTTIRNADCIFVIKAGCLMEQGSHKELLEKKEGMYKSLFLRQLDSAD